MGHRVGDRRGARALLGAEPIVVSLQNGVEKDEILRRAVGAQHVVGGVAHIASAIARPGVIVHTGRVARIILGEHSEPRDSPRLKRLVAALQAAGIDAAISGDIERTEWEKFVFGLDPAFAEDRLAFIDTLPAELEASMAGDLARGRRLELPWLSGAVVRMGERLGVPTPANRFACAALHLHAHDDASAGEPHDVPPAAHGATAAAGAVQPPVTATAATPRGE